MSTQPMQIPLVDLKRQHAQIDGEVRQSFEEILSSMHLFLGPNVVEFQKEFAEYLGVEHCLGVSDGTMAIYLALRGCGIEPGDEVITVSHTFFATVEAMVMAGAVPVFIDVDPSTQLMDPALIEQAITPRTRALLPVHLYGRMCDMDAIMAIARKHDLKVIEDTSQAHGARRNGHTAGTVGDVGTFSFYYSKNLGAYGEAGGVVTNDADIARRIEVLRDHGSPVRYHHEEIGLNSRLDELQAAVLRHKLPLLDGWNERRRRHAARYCTGLSNAPVGLPAPAGLDHVWHLFVIDAKGHREELQGYLKDRGIASGIHYPVPCHLQPACKAYGAGLGSLPVTESLAANILSIPMFPELESDEVDYVIDAVNDFFGVQSWRQEGVA